LRIYEVSLVFFLCTNLADLWSSIGVFLPKFHWCYFQSTLCSSLLFSQFGSVKFDFVMFFLG
jgi:hypothetical protein